MERKYEAEWLDHKQTTGEDVSYRDFAQRLVKKQYAQRQKENPQSFSEALDNALVEIDNIMSDFGTDVYFGKLVIDENKPHSLLLRTDIADDTIRSKYYLNMECNTIRYDSEIEGYKSKMEAELKEAMFPSEVSLKYDEIIEACEHRKAKAIVENPPLKFGGTLLKFEDKNKDEKGYERTFKISSDTAIMIIKQKAKFTSYVCQFTKRDGQEVTEVETDIVNK